MVHTLNTAIKRLGILFPLLLFFLQPCYSRFSISQDNFVQNSNDSLTIRFFDGLSAVPFTGLPLICVQGSDTVRLLTNSSGEIFLRLSPASLWMPTESGDIRYWIRNETTGENLHFFNESGKELNAFTFPSDKVMEVYILREKRNEIASIPSLPSPQPELAEVKKEKIKTESVREKQVVKTEKVSKPIVSVTSKRDSVISITPANEITSASNEKVYKVQILTSGKNLPANDPVFKGVQNVEVYSDKGIYKYTVGNFTSIQECVVLQEKMREKGFKGAFVVVFENGKRIR